MEELDEMIENIHNDLISRIDDSCELLEVALFKQRIRDILNVFGEKVDTEAIYEHPNGYVIPRNNIIGSQGRICIDYVHEAYGLAHKDSLIIDKPIELSQTLILIEEISGKDFSDSRGAILQKLREEKIDFLGI